MSRQKPERRMGVSSWKAAGSLIKAVDKKVNQMAPQTICQRAVAIWRSEDGGEAHEIAKTDHKN